MNFFLSGLQKLEQRSKKCIALRGGYVDYIQSLVAVSFLVRLRTYKSNLLSAKKFEIFERLLKFNLYIRVQIPMVHLLTP